MNEGTEVPHTLSAVLVAVGVVGLLASCVVAWFASGRDRRVSPFWGLAGPFGWTIAAMRGVQERQRRAKRSTDELNAMLMQQLTAQPRPVADASPSEAAPTKPATATASGRLSSRDRKRLADRAANHESDLVRASHHALGMLTHDWQGLPAVTRFRRAIRAAAESWTDESRIELREAAETVVFALRAPGSPYEASSRLAALQRALTEPDPEIV